MVQKCTSLGSVLEAVRIVAGFDDVAMINEPIEESSRHFFISKEIGPFREGEIGGDDQAGVFM